MVPYGGEKYRSSGLSFTKRMLVLVFLMSNVSFVFSMNSNGNNGKEYAELPAMGNARWNGIPSPEFNEQFFDYLQMALGSVSENGNTLLITAMGNDAAGVGPLANPPFIAATAQQRQASANRQRRLFACIMNYIHYQSYVFKYIMQNFQNDGIAAFRFIR